MANQTNCKNPVFKNQSDFHSSEAYGIYLKQNPLALTLRKEAIKKENEGVVSITYKPNGAPIKCKTCGSTREHPITGYCFICDTDNW